MTRLVLASQSPARLQLLKSAGIPAEVVVSGVDESVVQADGPEALSGILARLKAEAVAARLGPEAVAARLGPEAVAARPDSGPEPDRVLVLGCDSVLAFDGQILGKPTDADDAVRRWRAMRGRSGVLHTGHCLIDARTGDSAAAVASTKVHFADLTDTEIAAYVATGEPLRVAGAFTIDGFGGAFVDRIEGDPGTVIGLSLPLLRRMLSELGTELISLWRAG
ncbi:Maf-like protein [Planosporangium mesophilum]|uniref:Nucleoside triphosphate pyrophosphatase n=2 Tax=Planosporangium mesophilum TaxID=689768 RepID=A0A8J3WYD3_9ACTN|nr:Maf-like protein [Planosporangium mesophilum]